LEARAEAAAATVAGLLTGTTGGAVVAPAPARDGQLGGALAELRNLVSADGADLVLVAHDTAAGHLRLRLVIPDAHCAECVMPRATLESTVASRLGRLGITRVTIDDPREAA
jgi:hypothetical protein